MAYRPTELGNMVSVNPDRARKVLLTAFKTDKGNTTRVAEKLEVNVATVKRWITKLEIRDQIEALRAA